MGTIVQEYGPIYGEVANGTVQGRPNGSVYVPISNTISAALTTASNVVSLNGSVYRCNGVRTVAVSQDLASNIRYSLYSDSALTTQVGTQLDVPAGLFNDIRFTISYGTAALTPGNDYYLKIDLVNNNDPVATTVIQLVGA